MLTINTIHLEHFMCCENVSLDLSNKRNIVLEGDNGNGKSALLDAIALCLAEHRRADKYAEYVQTGYNECKIDLTATVNGEPIVFNIILLVSGGTPFNRIVTYKGKTYQNTEVSGLLNELELPFYSKLIFSMQGQDDIATMSASVRADYLQRLLQFDFDNALVKLREKLSEIETNQMYNQNQVDFNTKAIKSKVIKDSLPLPCSLTEYEEKKVHLDELEVLLKEKDKIFAALQETQQKITANKIRESELKTQIQHNANIDVEKEEILKQIEQLNTELGQLKIPESKDFDKQIKDIEDDIANRKSIIDADQGKLWRIKAQITSLKEREELHKQGKCPTCGQPTDFIENENNSKKIEELEDTSMKYANEIESYTESIKKLEILKNRINTEKFENAQAVADYNSKVVILTSNIKGLQSNYSTFEPYEIDETELPRICDELTKLELEVKEYQKKLDNLKVLSEEHKVLKAFVDDFSNTLLRNEWIEKDNLKTKSEIEDLEVQINKLTQIITQQEKDYEYHKEAKKLLDTDLPNYLIVKTCARLEQEMNNFIHVVFPTMNISLFQGRRGVEFYYSKTEKTDDKRKLISAKMASGFERSILSISFKIALCKAYNLSLSILDEIDAFASDGNSEKIYSSLLENDIFNQLFIITHKPNTLETMRDYFDDLTVYHVEKGVFTEVTEMS